MLQRTNNLVAHSLELVLLQGGERTWCCAARAQKRSESVSCGAKSLSISGRSLTWTHHKHRIFAAGHQRTDGWHVRDLTMSRTHIGHQARLQWEGASIRVEESVAGVKSAQQASSSRDGRDQSNVCLLVLRPTKEVVERWQGWRERAANHLAKQLLNHQREVLSLASLVSHCAAFGWCW